nr:chitobiase/beta-hexosaminidase C-terminal domain-containing protein [Lachnospiraceae bacterium]
AVGTLVTADDIVKETEDHTLYAKYSTVYQVAGVKTDIPEEAMSIFPGSRISLSTATPGATIYYTLNGSNPTRDSIRYTDAIVVSEDMADEDHNLVIKAFAVKDSYKDSEITAYAIGVNAESKDWGDAEDDAKASGYTSPADIPTGLWTYGIPAETFYTGANITCDFRVYSNKTLLKNGTDYTVKYKNNKNPGTATITVTGKGDYTGSITRSFTINAYAVDPEKIDLSKATVTASKPVYTGTNIELKDFVSVSLNGNPLTPDEDFTIVTQGDVVSAGKYDIAIVGIGEYTGAKTTKITVDQATLKLSDLEFGSEGAVATYSKSGAKPEFTITFGENELREKTDYTVTYKNNSKVANASDKKAPTITIKGIGNFKGSFTANYDVIPRSITGAFLSFEKKFYSGIEGDYVTKVTVIDDEGNKLGSKDYDVDYFITGAIFPGNYVTAVIWGKGNYTDRVEASYQILPTYDITETDVTLDAEYTFSKNGVTPKPVIKRDSVTLTEGEDYTLSYKNNKKLGVATVTITGKGQFAGSERTEYFSIVKKDISDFSLTAPDVIFANKTGKYKSAPVIKDENGNKLKNGTDYENIRYFYAEDTILPNKILRNKDEEVQATDIPGAGTIIRIEVSGKGNYEGTLTTVSTEIETPYTYRIALKSLSKAKVTIPSQIYTGNAVTPGKDQIVVKVGKETLLPEDYEITDYANNYKNGTAKVMISGKGNYTGTKTATFKIVKKSMFYTVVYNGNGSNSGSMKSQTIASGKRIKLSNFAYKKNYHITDNTVACWNTKADGSGTPYPANASITNDGNDGETLVLYAQWKKIAAPDYVDVSRPSKVKEASSQQIVTWGKVGGAVNYILYKSTSETGKYTKVGTTTKTTYTVKKLSAGKKYFYKVAVVVKDKVGGKSVNVTGDLSDVAGFGKSYDKPNIKGKLYFTVNSDYYDYDYDRSDATLSIENKGNEDFAFDLLADAQIDLTCKYVYTYWYYRLYKYIYTYNYSAALVFENGETVLEPGDADSSYWTFYHYYLQYNKSYWNSISATATFYCTYDGIYYKCKLTSGGKFTATAIRYAD